MHRYHRIGGPIIDHHHPDGLEKYRSDGDVYLEDPRKTPKPLEKTQNLHNPSKTHQNLQKNLKKPKPKKP